MSSKRIPFTSRTLRRSIVGAVSILALAPLLYFAACSSGSDNGGGGSTNNNTNNNPPPGAANQFAYVINFFGNTVQPYSTDGNGNLTPIGNPVTVGSHPHNVTVDKAGRFVYIANHDSNFVSGYRVNADGSLAPINNAPGSPVTNLNNNDPTDNNPHWSAFDTTGGFLYVINGVPPVPSTLKSYQVNADGTLTQIGTSGLLAQCFHGHNVAVAPNNNFIYVACEDSGVVYSFGRGANGAATGGTPTVVTAQNGVPPTAPSAVVDPSSSHLFVGVTNGVTVFNIDPATGNISGQTNFPAGNTPHSVTIDNNGHLYTANINDGTVSAFSINGGTLTSLGVVKTGGEPNQAVVHPDKTVLFTADQTTSTVTRFAIAGDGTLSPNPGTTAATLPGGSGTNGIAITNK
jgi:6-phosphogluconolactonase (cycloisomerase 2 family)